MIDWEKNVPERKWRNETDAKLRLVARARAEAERKRRELIARYRGVREYKSRERARAMRRFWGWYFAFCAAVVTLAAIYRAEIIIALGF